MTITRRGYPSARHSVLLGSVAAPFVQHRAGRQFDHPVSVSSTPPGGGLATWEGSRHSDTSSKKSTEGGIKSRSGARSID